MGDRPYPYSETRLHMELGIISKLHRVYRAPNIECDAHFDMNEGGGFAYRDCLLKESLLKKFRLHSLGHNEGRRFAVPRAASRRTPM